MRTILSFLASVVLIYVAAVVLAVAVLVGIAYAVHPADKEFQEQSKSFRESTSTVIVGPRMNMGDVPAFRAKARKQLDRATEQPRAGESRYRTVVVIELYEFVGGQWVFRGRPNVRMKERQK